jgi:hypothetical protein
MNSSQRLASYLRAKLRVLLVGPPGTGKTARIIEAATDAGFKTVIFRASLAERVDLGGCYVPDIAAGVTRALPLELLQSLRTAKVPTLLFLDDLGQAPMDVQASIMALFDDGALSPHVLIWGATNRPADKAGVSALCEPLRSRFNVAFAVATPTTEAKADGPTILSSWRDEVDSWTRWASEQGFAPEIVAWHRSTTGRSLYQWKPSADPALRMADFRSWAVVGRLWEAGLRDFDSVAAAIGKGAAAEFLAFAQLADQLPTPQQVWMDPHGAPVPTDPAAQYLIATMLGRAVEAKFAAALVTYIDRLPRVMGAYCAKDAFSRLGAKLVANAEWQKWWVKNSALFATSTTT